MNKLILPIGESAFQEMRDRNCYYVDKTSHINKLIDTGKYYFLSRPRRFGKSLLVSTLKELFEGNEKLFRGLHIHDRWDWTNSNPVLRLSFHSKYSEPGDLENNLENQLTWIENSAGIEPPGITGPDRFNNLILSLYQKTGQQVVILVDEYDKPILDLLDNKKQAEANRAYLHGVYGIIKGCADEVRFVFVTGISMYSRVSLFSGLNTLEDISLDPRYATICGYTDTDIDTVFAPELEGLDRNEIRHWYNGYSWLGEEKVYNPFDVLLLFSKRQFKPYWYETGTPSFLHYMAAWGSVISLNRENMEMPERELASFDLDTITANALLFQSGYLTIADHEVQPGGFHYTLEYPNHEVRLSLNQQLLGTVNGNFVAAERRAKKMAQFLAANDFEEFAAELSSFFSNIPNEWYVKNRMQHYEGFYASMVYACFTAIGVDVKGEESTSRGRSDLVVVHAGEVFVMELKVAENPADQAKVEAEAIDSIAQIRKNNYAGKYRHRRGKIHLLGVVFNEKDRNVAMILAERD